MRGETFVTRKITRAVAAIAYGMQNTLYLGNLEARRDWSHARDCVEGMWRIVQHNTPEDFVLGSGTSHSVREFVERSFNHVDIDIQWEGEGVDEIGRDGQGNVIVRIDPRYFRLTEVENLIADASKAKRLLGWEPTTSFAELVAEMVDSDMAACKNG